jgi:hypothetical protein
MIRIQMKIYDDHNVRVAVEEVRIKARVEDVVTYAKQECKWLLLANNILGPRMYTNAGTNYEMMDTPENIEAFSQGGLTKLEIFAAMAMIGNMASSGYKAATPCTSASHWVRCAEELIKALECTERDKK